MDKRYERKDFLKMALLSPLAIYIKPAELLEKNFPGLYVLNTSVHVDYYKKQDTAYNALRKGFNKRIEKFPAVIAVCKNTTGVSEAIQYAIKNNLPVAVKSGGHCMEGFSANDNGMVINLSLLNSTTWISKEMITVGPACLLANLYNVILPKGRIIPGGSCATVAIGGLVLGGGYGLLARKFGLTCDSLLEITMVDGKGNIVNSADDKELLWACKGGGNGNFGVVTELKFKTHPAPKTLQSFRFKTHQANGAKAASILKKWFELTATLPEGCFSAYVLNGKTVYILLTNADKHDQHVQQIVNGLSAISEKTTKTSPQPLAKALPVFYGRKDPLYFKNASAGLYKNFADIEGMIESVTATVCSTPGMIYQVNTLGGNIMNSEFESNAAFAHRAFPYFSELQTYWEKPAQSKRLLEKFEMVQQLFTAHGISAQYRNYPDINFKNWDAKYYGSSYSRLQQVKKKYDPHNVISHSQSVQLP